jgi:hypothetical protein
MILPVIDASDTSTFEAEAMLWNPTTIDLIPPPKATKPRGTSSGVGQA